LAHPDFAMPSRPVRRITRDTPECYHSGQMPFCAALVIVMVFRRPIILVAGQVLQHSLALANSLSLLGGVIIDSIFHSYSIEV
jgi:hypothetical protein